MNATVNLSTLTTRDQQTATYMVTQRNTRIAEENVRRAAQVPPLAALPLLPLGTNAELRTSYESLFVEAVLALHENYHNDAGENNATARQIKEALKTGPTQAQLNTALAALTT